MKFKIAGASAVVLTLLPASAADMSVASHILPPLSSPGAITTLTAAQLCAKGFRTSTERPDEDYTEALKRKQLAELGYADQNPKHYEEDHLVSLEIGGHPSDPRNLWPEPYTGRCNAHVKDTLENRLKTLVCSGKLGLAEAQAEISHDWVRSYNIHVRRLVCN